MRYSGVYTRKDNPEQFWLYEGIFTAPALFFMGGGLCNLWMEHKRRQHQKFLLVHPHEINKKH